MLRGRVGTCAQPSHQRRRQQHREGTQGLWHHTACVSISTWTPEKGPPGRLISPHRLAPRPPAPPWAPRGQSRAAQAQQLQERKHPEKAGSQRNGPPTPTCSTGGSGMSPIRDRAILRASPCFPAPASQAHSSLMRVPGRASAAPRHRHGTAGLLSAPPDQLLPVASGRTGSGWQSQAP